MTLFKNCEVFPDQSWDKISSQICSTCFKLEVYFTHKESYLNTIPRNFNAKKKVLEVKKQKICISLVMTHHDNEKNQAEIGDVKLPIDPLKLCQRTIGCFHWKIDIKILPNTKKNLKKKIWNMIFHGKKRSKKKKDVFSFRWGELGVDK